MIEQSKTFNRLAKIAGLYPPVVKRTHRGIIARLAIPKLEKFESAEFEKSCPRIIIRQPIPVREFGVITSYINIIRGR